MSFSMLVVPPAGRSFPTKVFYSTFRLKTKIPRTMKTTLTLLACAFLFACSKPQPVDERAARNKETITQFYEKLVNAHNADMVESYFTADVIDHHDAAAEPIVGIDNLKTGFKEFFSTFPDAHLQMQFMVAEGDTVVAKVTMTGTNT